MSEYHISFSASSVEDSDSFKLLELPAELNGLIENAIGRSNTVDLKVKGQANEDAVLCTNDKTYAMRSVALSNSVLVVSSSSDDSEVGFGVGGVVIRDQVNDIIELVPAVPKLHKLAQLLRGQEYDEVQDPSLGEVTRKFTYADARAELQASDAELDQGLKERRILIVNGELRPIAPAFLDNVLELILNLLVSLSLPHSAASVEELSSTLADEHEISMSVSVQVMSWFGSIQVGEWCMDVNAVVREVGMGLLRNHKREPINMDVFLTKWKSLVGDTFESSVSIDLLAGNYLTTPSSFEGVEALSYFPSATLSIDPAARFADLFRTRPRWKAEVITPFLTDIAVNSKERDKLLLKYCRATTDSQGVWYTARAQYNG